MRIQAFYDNGQVIFKEQKLPMIKTPIEIELPAEISSKKDNQYKKIDFNNFSLCGIWKDRGEFADSVKYVKKIRKSWGTNKK